jgi:2'-hydroxyisoflavone reductase
MKLLLIGGTRFVGRHIVESALARGHEVTLFNRGRTGKGLFPVEEIVGDRDGEIDKLEGRKWDAVIDTCGYFPRIVAQSASLLKDAVHTYCFISTISVYKDEQPHPIHETGELIRFDETPEKEEITGESYGGFKVLCEETVAEHYGADRTLIIRPGLVVGPFDPSDRFTYWIDRYGSRGPILVPDRAQQQTQFIDARDLAEFTVRMVENKGSGTFNGVGPAHDTNLGELWSVCKQNCGGLPEEVVVSDEFLIENDVKEWVDLPFLFGVDDDGLTADITAALSHGLTIRRMAETVADTSEWHKSRGEVELKTGLSREREAELIAKWQAAHVTA